jgi:hypothetical protein
MRSGAAPDLPDAIWAKSLMCGSPHPTLPGR